MSQLDLEVPLRFTSRLISLGRSDEPCRRRRRRRTTKAVRVVTCSVEITTASSWCNGDYDCNGVSVNDNDNSSVALASDHSISINRKNKRNKVKNLGMLLLSLK
jgi:hypothetical protein